jgi:hypothetical protein
VLPEETKKSYDAFKKSQTVGLKDPELDNVSEEFKCNLQILIDLLLKQYEPVITRVDEFYQKLTNHCVLYLLMGEVKELPED